jgi:peptidoglycan hydrolase-like protein with peptidoglycan-binding domain
MAFSLIWLPDVLSRAGLKVAPAAGWESRGYHDRDVGKTLGVLCHHTGSPPSSRRSNMPSLDTLIKGRPGLPGPLAQLGLGRDGTYYIVAAGLCNHAGDGHWRSIKNGNSNFIGIEAENTGALDDPWPAAQVDAYHQGVAAILKHVGLDAQCCAGHKEWAPGRKIDPYQLDMDAFRASVHAILTGAAPAVAAIPAAEPPSRPGGAAGRPTLRRGVNNDRALVRSIQQDLGLTVDGIFAGLTEARVRAFQRERHLVPDGIVGPKTWAALDASRAPRAA